MELHLHRSVFSDHLAPEGLSCTRNHVQDEQRWATASVEMEKEADESSGWKGMAVAGGTVRVCQIMIDIEKGK